MDDFFDLDYTSFNFFFILTCLISHICHLEFEAWSIDDRMMRPTSTIQQKSALLAANLRDKGQRTHESHNSSLQHNNTTSQGQSPQHQHHLGASLSSHSVVQSQNQSSSNVSESPIRRQWQLRSYSAVSKESSDRAGRKTASNTITNRKSISGNHTSLGSGSGTQGSTQSVAKESGGSALYTLRRTRSAPILASGQLSCTFCHILYATTRPVGLKFLTQLGNSAFCYG